LDNEERTTGEGEGAKAAIVLDLFIEIDDDDPTSKGVMNRFFRNIFFFGQSQKKRNKT
jgi:hypothetical protein